MDSKTTIQEIKNWSSKIRSERNWHPDARSLAISICLEASELLEHFQFKESLETEKEIKVNKIKKDEISKEVGDVLNYLLEFCERLGIDMSKSLKKTLKKIEEKYPVEELKKGGSDFYFAQKRKYREGRK